MSEQNSGLIEITGLWIGEKNGKKYFKGYFGNATILIFKNEFKKEDKHPDYKMFVAPKKQQQTGTQEQKQGDYPGSDDIPF